MVNLGFFREHRLPLPFPKKPLKFCPLLKWQNVNQVMSRGDVCEGRDFPAGLVRELYWGNFVPSALKICRRYALEALKYALKPFRQQHSRQPLPKKTTQNSALITRQSTKSQAINKDEVVTRLVRMMEAVDYLRKLRGPGKRAEDFRAYFL